MARRSGPPPFVDVNVHLDISGPLFRPEAKLTVGQNAHRMVEGLVQQGQKMVQAGWTGSRRGRGGVLGRTHSLQGQPWRYIGTVTPEFVYPWLGAGQRQYRGGRSRVRNRAFASALGRIRAAKPELVANLTKGIE